MENRLPMIDRDGEVRELNAEDFKHFKPASEVLPADLYAGLIALNKRGRGKQIAPTKRSITLRLPEEVLNAFSATGAGWQTRIGIALQDWLKTHDANIKTS